MLGIATHDSCTGERPTWWSCILLPFAKCQSKTIKEQYDCGCRLFDIRIKLVNGEWRAAHGYYVIKKKAEEIIAEINSFGDCRITLMYEGRCSDNEHYLEFVKYLKKTYSNIKYGTVRVKFGQSENLMEAEDGYYDKPMYSKYICLDGRSWHTFIPIPWLWKKVYYNNPQFSEDYYTYVDFL